MIEKIKRLLQNSNMDEVELRYWVEHIPYMKPSDVKKLITILEVEQNQQEQEERRIRKRIKEATSIIKLVS